MNIPDAGFIAGITGIVIAIMCLISFRKHKLELSSVIRQHQTDCAGKCDQMKRNIAVLESSAQIIEQHGRTALTRSRRSEAMQLLRSGMPPDSAAAKLGIARREMRLILTISNILA